MESYNFLPKNMPVLEQSQTIKKFGPFLIILPKVRRQIFPAPYNFSRPLLSVEAEISAPWQHCDHRQKQFYLGPGTTGWATFYVEEAKD
jgi:hypothetical protein